MKTKLWLGYDLGLKGDYESLYAWLDEQNAKECGDGLAFFEFEYHTDLLEELKAILEAVINVTPKTRIYVIHTVEAQRRAKGKFLIGGRKSPPWSGFGSSAGNEIDQ